MRLESRPRRRERVLARPGPDTETVILLDPDTGQYYTLDDVGSRVWELCDGGRSVEEIAAVITSEYEAPAKTIAADVQELLAELAGEKLVVEAE
jgi:hypothetical protein